MTSRFTAVLFSLVALSCLGADWPQFRGPELSGVSEQNVPVVWNEGQNMPWRTDLPGRGLSGPIVLGDRVYVTACSGPQQDRLHVLCFQTADGKKVWERQFWATGRTMCHPKMSVAAPTPASDGKHIFAFYSTNDVICLDLNGNLKWFRGLTQDYPNASNSLGMASSPIVVDDTLVLQVENDSESFAAGLKTDTGENRWKIDRPIQSNWTSPLLLRGAADADKVVLLQGGKGLVAVEPQTGKEVWRFGEGCSTIPSSVISDGVVYVPSSGVTALRPAAGSANPQVLWQAGKLGPSTPSPVVYRGQIFSVNKAGVLACGDIKSGEVLWQLRLQGAFSGTPVASNGHLFFVNDAGLAQVVKTGEQGEVVGTYDFKEAVMCSPAIAGNALYVRSDGHLWKIAEK